MIQKIFHGEEKRNRWLKRILFGFIISLIIIISLLNNSILFLLISIFIIISICSCLVYRAFQFTVILPMVVSDADLGKLSLVVLMIMMMIMVIAMMMMMLVIMILVMIIVIIIMMVFGMIIIAMKR